MELPPNASLFTYDTVTMYPSINMAQCILHLSKYLSSPEITSKYGFSSKALIEALTLIMLNNRMQFGDIIVKQLSGIAMGMSPAPTIANLFVAIYKTTHVLPYIPQVCSTFAVSLMMALVTGFTIRTPLLTRATGLTSKLA